MILIQCYSGWRPQELGLIELANVDLENGTFKGGIKTEAGEDRVVPIHSKFVTSWSDITMKLKKSAAHISSTAKTSAAARL